MHPLKQLKYIDNIIKNYNQELDELEEMRGNIQSQSYDAVSVFKSEMSDKTAVAAVNIAALKDEIWKSKYKLIETKLKCTKAMNRMTMPNANVIYYYYWKNYTFEKMAATMNISYQWAFELHKRAKEEFDSIYFADQNEKEGDGCEYSRTD